MPIPYLATFEAVSAFWCVGLPGTSDRIRTDKSRILNPLHRPILLRKYIKAVLNRPQTVVDAYLKIKRCRYVHIMVSWVGFEPTNSWSLAKCICRSATRTFYDDYEIVNFFTPPLMPAVLFKYSMTSRLVGFFLSLLREIRSSL